MIQTEPKHWKIIQSILKKYPYHFYAFGSRATHIAKEFSDLDLCYKENIPKHIITEIRGDFEDSNLPYTVDIVAWSDCSDDFKKHIEKDLLDLSKII